MTKHQKDYESLCLSSDIVYVLLTFEVKKINKKNELVGISAKSCYLSDLTGKSNQTKKELNVIPTIKLDLDDVKKKKNDLLCEPLFEFACVKLLEGIENMYKQLDIDAKNLKKD